MSKKQTLFWLCLIAGLLLVNTFVHYSSPVYSAYRQNLDKIQNEYVAFSNQLSLLTVVILTNRLADIERQLASVEVRAPGAGASATAPGREHSAPGLPEKDRREQLPCGNAYQMNGVMYVNISGWSYSLGDNFGGSPIIDISPLGFRTADNVFYTFPSRAPITHKTKTGDLL